MNSHLFNLSAGWLRTGDEARQGLWFIFLLLIGLGGASTALAEVAPPVEEPYGFFGSINPTGMRRSTAVGRSITADVATTTPKLAAEVAVEDHAQILVSSRSEAPHKALEASTSLPRDRDCGCIDNSMQKLLFRDQGQSVCSSEGVPTEISLGSLEWTDREF